MSKKNRKSQGELFEEALVPLEEQPYDVPENWVWTELGYISILINGDRGKNYPSRDELIEFGIPFINAGHIESGRVNLENMNFISDEKYESLGSGKVKTNDILYCLRGTLGKTALVKNIEKAAIASSLVIIRPHHFIETRYLFNYLVSPLGNSMIKMFDNGSAQPNLSAGNVKKYKVPLPPLYEQKRIADKVERLLGKVNQAKQLIEEAKATFELRRAAILDKAFRGELTKKWREDNKEIRSADVLLNKISAIRNKCNLKSKSSTEIGCVPFKLPVGWKWILLEELIQLSSYGTSAKTNDDTTGAPVLRMGNIVDGQLTLDNLKYLPRNHADVEKYDLEEYDILFNRTNSYELVGKSAVVRGQAAEMTYASYLVNVRLYLKEKMADYICYYINGHLGRNYLLSMVTQQVGQANINASKLASLLIPLPPEEEIVQITEQINRLFEYERSILSSLEIEVQTDSLTQAILSKAFRGELGTNIASEKKHSISQLHKK